MARQYIDIHVIQTVPPSNMNRDDTGSPKTATYGGVRRARVSSQAWKRATRKHFEETLDASKLGVRTKRIVELIEDQLVLLAPDADSAARHASVLAVLAATKIKVSKPRKGDAEPEEARYLVFLSRLQVEALGQLAAEHLTTGEAVSSRVAAAIKNKNSVDLALFGRMVAEVADFNVDAAAQVAHAISVHAVDNEFDFFTAVDDHKQHSADEDSGVGMIGTVEFNSSTLYRYATVNFEELERNLGDATAARLAVASFVESFVKSLPTGKQNTFANRTLPDAVIITLRTDQPVNWVGAFEEPVKGQGRSKAAAQALATYATGLEKAFGNGRKHTWVVSAGEGTSSLSALGETVSFSVAVEAVTEALARGEE